MFKIFMLLTLMCISLTNAYAQPACEACPSPLQQCNPDPDIPPGYPWPWNCKITEIQVDINGIICPACVSFCWRQPYPTSSKYQIYLCSFCINTDCAGDEFNNLPWYEKFEVVGGSIITGNPDNMFINIPDCPSEQYEVEVFWSICWDGVNTCTASNSWCEKTYNVCKINGIINKYFISATTSPGNNCVPPCTNLDPCN